MGSCGKKRAGGGGKGNIVGAPKRIKRSQHVKTITTASEYTLSFDLKPTAKQHGWRNILHFAQGNGRSRIPAFWFYSRTTRLHCRMARHGNGNDGCDPGHQLALNKWTNVKITLSGRSFSVYYNGRLMCRNNNFHGRRWPGKSGVKVWASDPWYHPASAFVRSLNYSGKGGSKKKKRKA